MGHGCDGYSYCAFAPIARRCYEIGWVSFLVADEREHGSLGVLAIDDPTSSGYLHRAVQDLPSSGLDTFDGCADRVDVKIEHPA